MSCGVLAKPSIFSYFSWGSSSLGTSLFWDWAYSVLVLRLVASPPGLACGGGRKAVPGLQRRRGHAHHGGAGDGAASSAGAPRGGGHAARDGLPLRVPLSWPG